MNLCSNSNNPSLNQSNGETKAANGPTKGKSQMSSESTNKNTTDSNRPGAKHLNSVAPVFSQETHRGGNLNKPNTQSQHLTEKLEIELLNNQLQQLQQQKQQISYLNGAATKANQSESSSSPSPTSSSSSLNSNKQRLQQQQNKQKNELFDMIMNYTNRFDSNEDCTYFNRRPFLKT